MIPDDELEKLAKAWEQEPCGPYLKGAMQADYGFKSGYRVCEARMAERVKELEEIVEVHLETISEMQTSIEMKIESRSLVEARNAKLVDGLKLATTRLEIWLGRMRACHEDTLSHEVSMSETYFIEEARQALKEVDEKV